MIANPQLRIGPDDGRRHDDHARSCWRQAAGGADVETNVATGYHAIEFLLWGQDLNGTGPGAGNRPCHRLRTGEPAPTAIATAAAPI